MGCSGSRFAWHMALACLLSACMLTKQAAGQSVISLPGDLVATEVSGQDAFTVYGTDLGFDQISRYICDPDVRGDGGREGRRLQEDDRLAREKTYFFWVGPARYKLSSANASQKFGVYNGDLIPAPRDQGACSTGVAEAFAAAVDTTIATLLNRVPADVYRASAPELYYCSQPGARSCPSGWTIPAAASQVQLRMPRDERACAPAASSLRSVDCLAAEQCPAPAFRCQAKALGDYYSIQKHISTKGGVITMLNQYNFDESSSFPDQAYFSFDNFVSIWDGLDQTILESPNWEFVGDYNPFSETLQEFLIRSGNLTGTTTAVLLVGYDAAADGLKSWYVLNSKGPDWPKPGVGADSVFKAAFGAAGIGAAGQTYGLECTPVSGSVFDPWGLESWRPRKPLMPENASVALDVTNPICYLYKPVRPDWTDTIAAQFGIGIVDLVDANLQLFACKDNSLRANFTVKLWNEETGANNGVTLRICGIPPPSFSQVAFIEDPTLRTQRAMLRLYAALTSSSGTGRAGGEAGAVVASDPTAPGSFAASLDSDEDDSANGKADEDDDFGGDGGTSGDDDTESLGVAGSPLCVSRSSANIKICMAPSTNAVSITVKGPSSAISGAVQQLLGLAAAKGMLEMPGGVSLTISLEGVTNSPSLALPSSWSGVTTLRSVVVTGYCLAAALPDGWKGLPNLQTLHIVGAAGCRSASDTYPLPAWAGGMPALTVLELKDLNVAGAIPGTWSTFPRLQQLLLRNVRVSGSLPASYGSGLRAIKSISISQTLVSSHVPVEWGSLSELLTRLDLSGNFKLRGCIPLPLWRRAALGQLRLRSRGTLIAIIPCWPRG